MFLGSSPFSVADRGWCTNTPAPFSLWVSVCSTLSPRSAAGLSSSAHCLVRVPCADFLSLSHPLLRFSQPLEETTCVQILVSRSISRRVQTRQRCYGSVSRQMLRFYPKEVNWGDLINSPGTLDLLRSSVPVWGRGEISSFWGAE